jgi:hypothetical protein
MARGTGFGSFIMQIAVRIEKPYDRLLKVPQDNRGPQDSGSASTLTIALRGKLGDDETISYEMADVMIAAGVPSHAPGTSYGTCPIGNSRGRELSAWS